MKYSPHNYQKYVIEFIKQHPIAAILLDMGMGKTSIVLSALNELMYDSFEVTKVLIIAPLRVARNTWSDEIKKWDHLKGLRYSIVVGTAAERKRHWQQMQIFSLSIVKMFSGLWSRVVYLLISIWL